MPANTHAHAGMTWLLYKALKGRTDFKAAVKHSHRFHAAAHTHVGMTWLLSPHWHDIAAAPTKQKRQTRSLPQL